MPECAKTHLQQSRISKFPRTPLFKGRGGKGKGGEKREGKANGRRKGKDREGRGGTGRRGGMGVVGRGGALDMGSAPPPTLNKLTLL